MPNWCYTNINICHNDKDKMKDLYDKIMEWTSKNYSDNGFGVTWLGNIVGFSGIADPDKDVYPRCRGTLSSISFDNNQINLSTETAWAPMMQMWQMIVDKYLPDADIWYTAEEPGNCIFESNDPDVIGKYYIDIWEPPEEFEDEESIYEAEEDDVIDFLQRVLKTEEKNIDALFIMADEIEDRWFSINMWANCDISECE